VSRVVAPDVSARSLDALISLEGRRGVVTGAAQGIGRAIARRLAEAGARLLVCDLNVEGAQEAQAELGENAQASHVDVTSSESVKRVAERAVEEFGGLDIWVNTPGIYPVTPLLEIADEEWERVIDVNLRGTFVGSREAARMMIQCGSAGVILNIASTASYRVAGEGVSHYVAAKFGVRGLTKGLAVELGPHGIRALAIAPCVTLTPGLEATRGALERAGFQLDDLGNDLPLGRIAVPDDIARVALFCVSDLATLMTGTTVQVDAGYLSQ
jgi:NAD(P)-dependent dehydrogenase (short-subunit alcohol dehydrogenase family)